MRREQILEVGDKEIILTNRITDDDLLKANYEEKKDIGKGFTKEKTMRKVASIPIEVLMMDYDGYIFYNAPTGSPEAKIALRKFLQKHPEYYCSEGGI